MAIMPEDSFGILEQLLESENPSSSFDLLIGQFRAAKDYRSLFEARLMRKRLELGLPLFLTEDLSALPSELRDAYSRAVTEAAREVGELFLSDGEIAQAWPYLRATGDSARVADAIEKVEAGDDVNRIIEIAFQEGVNPAKGLELMVAKYGICRALSAFEVSVVEKDREKCIAVLARNLHAEAVVIEEAALGTLEVGGEATHRPTAKQKKAKAPRAESGADAAPARRKAAPKAAAKKPAAKKAEKPKAAAKAAKPKAAAKKPAKKPGKKKD